MSSIEKAIERLSKAREKKSDSDEMVAGKDAVSPRKASSEMLADKQSIGKAVNPEAVFPKPSTDDHKPGYKDHGQNRSNTEVNEFRFNFQELSAVGYLTPGSDNKILEEEYRAIKRPVLMNAFGKGAVPIERGNLIAITSSLPGEGKTYTSLNLALSIATELDSTVLLIDGDILKPQLSILLGLEGRRGLTDVLCGSQTEIKDVLLSTQIPKLKILPAGNKFDNSTELLASDAMEQLVIELGNRYQDRIVLFDSPPLLATSEATVLNHLMGQILMVVESGKTPMDAVKDSLSHIDEEKVIGLVLNKTNGHAGRSGYGSYASYA